MRCVCACARVCACVCVRLVDFFFSFGQREKDNKQCLRSVPGHHFSLG